MTNKDLIQSLIEIAGEIEAEYYNEKFGLYRQEVVDALLQKIKDIITTLHNRDFDMEKEAETNEEFDYALQFID